MANKTLKDMFPDVAIDIEQPEVVHETNETAATKAANKAASELLNYLEESGNKTRRCVCRLDEKTYLQFFGICKKKGISTSSVLRIFINDFIQENKHYLNN